jgi:hypothetical protein
MPEDVVPPEDYAPPEADADADAEPAQLPVHPLVIGLDAAGPHPYANVVAASTRALDCARVFGARRRAAGWGAAAEDWDRMAPAAGVNEFSAGNATFVIVSGYLGGQVELVAADPAAAGRIDLQAPGQINQPTRVLYLDAGLSTWLLVALEDIALFNRAKDASAAFGLLDILWLHPEARVVSGDRSQSVRRNYLNGPFVRAEDYAASVSGGTYPRTPGLLLEASSPGCCTRTRR